MTQKVGGIEFDVDVDASGVKSASSTVQSNLKDVETSFNKVDAAATSTGASMASGASKGSKGLRNMRAAAGQLGFQVQDMAVQAQMGTSALVILGQQGSQVASIFGPTGAIVGGVLAVGAAIASVMVPSMMDGGDAAEDLTEKLKEMGKTNELTINQQKFLKQVEEEETEEKKKKIAEIEKEIAKQETLAKRLKESAASYGRMAKASKVRIDNGSLEDMRKELERLKAQIDVVNEDFGDTKIDPKKAEDANKTYSNRLSLMQESLNMEGEILAAANARQFAIMQQGGNEQLALLEEQLAAQRARKQFEREQEKAEFEEERANILDNEHLNAEQKAALVSELDELEKQAKEQHQNALTNIENDGANARTKIATDEGKAKLAAAQSGLGALSNLMNTESRKMFEIGKVAATANAIIDGISAVQGAYATGNRLGGPPLGAAFAAAAAAGALANVKQIQSTQYGSTSTGQSYSDGVVANNTTSTDSSSGGTSKTYSLNFTGNEPVNAQELADILNEAAADGVVFKLGS